MGVFWWEKEEGGTNNTKVSTGRNAGSKGGAIGSLRTLWGCQQNCIWSTDSFLGSNETTRLVRCKLDSKLKFVINASVSQRDDIS